jgi:hypothetical protein
MMVVMISVISMVIVFGTSEISSLLEAGKFNRGSETAKSVHFQLNKLN